MVIVNGTNVIGRSIPLSPGLKSSLKAEPKTSRRCWRASGAVRALVLTPTRELAAQVAESERAYGPFLALRSDVVFGRHVLAADSTVGHGLPAATGAAAGFARKSGRAHH